MTELATRFPDELLFGGRARRAYAILDGARDLDLLVELERIGVRSECLIAGELEPEELVTAPHLVPLIERGAMVEWLGREDRAAEVVCVLSDAEILHVAAHFHGLALAVLPDGRVAWLRYYDPRVLRRLLESASEDQRAALFGRVVSAFVLPGDPDAGQSAAVFER